MTDRSSKMKGNLSFYYTKWPYFMSGTILAETLIAKHVIRI